MICLTIKNDPSAVFPQTRRHKPALASLSQAQRDLVLEAASAPLDYVPNPMFRRASAEKELFNEGLDIGTANTGWYHPILEEYLSTAASSSARLSTLEEKHLFLRYNYARQRTARLLERFRTHPGKRLAGQIAHWYDRVRQTRALITGANLALVLAMAKRVRMVDVDFGEFISEGNMALLHAVEKFDTARGFKFSTYACRAILKAFSRIAGKAGRYRNMFPTEFDPSMEKSHEMEYRRQTRSRDAIEEIRYVITDNAANLTDVERRVIGARFALNHNQDTATMTLEEVGQMIGVTKERVRQIQNQALEKLRRTLET